MALTPGYKTTEFWGRAVVTVVGLLVGSGTVQPDVGGRITDATNQVVPIIQTIIDGIVQVIGIIGALIIQFRHGKERSALKVEELRRRLPA